MSTSTVLLALLEQEPAHGYTLKQKYDGRFAQKRPLAFGQVYASLARFERQGLAEMVDVETGEGPERKRYRITPEGAQLVTDWVYTAQEPGVFSTSTLFARVTVALLSGRDPQQVLDTQRESHLERMRELQAQRRTARGSDLLAVTYELAHLDADLKWIEQAGRRPAAEKGKS
ncbi:PadR family transcriptional regulator [Nocardioides panaciterrulae]|uniref:DNA-binding PadR family transcriptional regulator n=1 Tax=Nocardioides panaciterrulae TaxID=661492 RepID=A0A7Y9E5L0_9ACTN|nr:PadR family transcriptional regulator [Nocardioides panaciterrulae]NYD41504.1 DNA-binding PadR family transcriptional regulator [Nocardioides panaciterrulae]